MLKTTIKGSFSVRLIRDGKEVLSLPRSSNLICIGAMERISSAGSYVHVGTGNTAPAFSDTSLVGFLAASSANSFTGGTAVLNGTDYEKEVSSDFDFGVGGVIGNVSELGLSPSASGATDLSTRALFKDVLGDPTTITVTVQDQLVITYFLKKTISMVPFVSSLSATVSGSPVVVDYTIRPCISIQGGSGSSADYLSSIYIAGVTSGLYMTANEANRISVDPVTYTPTAVNAAGDRSNKGSVNIVASGTGSIVTHTMVMPTTKGNYQWISATFSADTFSSANTVFFQIEFDGPNYITKTNTDTITFVLKELVNQVV